MGIQGVYAGCIPQWTCEGASEQFSNLFFGEKFLGYRSQLMHLAQKRLNGSPSKTDQEMFLMDINAILFELREYLRENSHSLFLDSSTVSVFFQNKFCNFSFAPLSKSGKASWEYRHRLWLIAHGSNPHRLIAHVWVCLVENFNNSDRDSAMNAFDELFSHLHPEKREEILQEADWAFQQLIKIYQELSTFKRRISFLGNKIARLFSKRVF